MRNTDHYLENQVIKEFRECIFFKEHVQRTQMERINSKTVQIGYSTAKIVGIFFILSQTRKVLIMLKIPIKKIRKISFQQRRNIHTSHLNKTRS